MTMSYLAEGDRARAAQVVRELKLALSRQGATEDMGELISEALLRSS